MLAATGVFLAPGLRRSPRPRTPAGVLGLYCGEEDAGVDASVVGVDEPFLEDRRLSYSALAALASTVGGAVAPLLLPLRRRRRKLTPLADAAVVEEPLLLDLLAEGPIVLFVASTTTPFSVSTVCDLAWLAW